MQTRLVMSIEGKQIGEDAFDTWKPLTDRVAVLMGSDETMSEAVEKTLRELRSQIKRMGVWSEDNSVDGTMKSHSEDFQRLLTDNAVEEILVDESKIGNGVTDCGSGQYVLGE